MTRLFTRFARNNRGAAAAEFVLWLVVLVPAVLNVTDLGFYVFQAVQVESAAQAAVQMAWKQCDYTKSASPLLNTCSTLKLTGDTTARSVQYNMQTAAQSLSLQTGITLASTDILEGYFCSNGSGALVNPTSGSTVQDSDWKAPSALSSTISKCSASGLSGKNAGDYVRAKVHYTYASIFPYASVLTVLGTDISKTAVLRLDGGS